MHTGKNLRMLPWKHCDPPWCSKSLKVAIPGAWKGTPSAAVGGPCGDGRAKGFAMAMEAIPGITAPMK